MLYIKLILNLVFYLCHQTAKAGQPIEVVITGKSASDTIRGFLLQARHGDKPVGKFTVLPADRFAQTLNCGAPGVSINMLRNY